jgi:DNA-binding MarR family transcriptional regulator
MPHAPTLRLSEFLPFRLSVLTNTLSRRIAERYEQEFGLTIWQWRVIAVLGETPGLSASEITERTAMDKVAVSRAVAALMERHLLKRRAARDDARKALLELTTRGRSIYDRIGPMALKYEQELANAVTPAELAQLKHLMDRFAQVVSPDRALW